MFALSLSFSLSRSLARSFTHDYYTPLSLTVQAERNQQQHLAAMGRAELQKELSDVRAQMGAAARAASLELEAQRNEAAAEIEVLRKAAAKELRMAERTAEQQVRDANVAQWL